MIKISKKILKWIKDKAKQVNFFMEDIHIPIEKVEYLSLRTPKENEEANKKALSKESEWPKSYEMEELKALSMHLKYAFLGNNNTYPISVSSSLSLLELDKLLCVLKEYREALGWSIDDIKGISPALCMHRILLEDEYQPKAQPQRRLNPVMQEVVKEEVIKLLDAYMIYPISDSVWVSPTQVDANKGV